MNSPLVICIGAALVDEIFSSKETIREATSNPSGYKRSIGGVARNIAALLSQLGHRVELITHLGNDAEGNWLIYSCRALGIGLTHAVQNDQATGRFMALLQPNGELFTAASYSNIETVISPEFLATKTGVLKTASLLLIDCNLSRESLEWIVDFARQEQIPCIIEPVSVSKAKRLQTINWQHVLLFTPNTGELQALSNHTALDDSIRQLLDAGLQQLWLRSGKEGSMLYTATGKTHLHAPDVQVVDTTGAGDAALAGWIHAWLMQYPEADWLKYGHALAAIMLQQQGADLPHLTRSVLTSAFDNHI